MRAVNLIPAEHREGAAVGVGRSEGAAYALMGLILGLAVMIGLYGMAKRQVDSRSAQAASLAAQAQTAQAQASQLAPYTSFIALREQRQQDATTLVDSRFDWAHAMHELGRVIPPFVTLESVTGTVGAAPSSGTSSTSAPSTTAPSSTTPSTTSGAAASSTVASTTPPGAVPSMTLGGCAITQKAVAILLERLRLMDGVSTVSLQSSTGASILKGGAGAKAAAKTGANESACGSGAPKFALAIDFDALPSTAAETASATAPKRQTVASTGAASTGAATTLGSAVR